MSRVFITSWKGKIDASKVRNWKTTLLNLVGVGVGVCGGGVGVCGRGTHPQPVQISFIFMQFSKKKFGQIVGWRPHLWFGVPLRENPGSVTEQYHPE